MNLHLIILKQIHVICSNSILSTGHHMLATTADNQFLTELSHIWQPSHIKRPTFFQTIHNIFLFLSFTLLPYDFSIASPIEGFPPQIRK